MTGPCMRLKRRSGSRDDPWSFFRGWHEMQNIPLATYRIQFQSGFTFDDAAHILDYLATLGVTHLYASPCLQAVQGSTHGYDVVNHARVNTELGGEEGHERLVRALHRAGMGQILDIVPNHMAVTGDKNEWWWESWKTAGQAYASYFDVDWTRGDQIRHKICSPSGRPFRRVLEKGEIRLERHQATFLDSAIVKICFRLIPIPQPPTHRHGKKRYRCPVSAFCRSPWLASPPSAPGPPGIRRDPVKEVIGASGEDLTRTRARRSWTPSSRANESPARLSPCWTPDLPPGYWRTQTRLDSGASSTSTPWSGCARKTRRSSKIRTA